jgi:hypothetical protein
MLMFSVEIEHALKEWENGKKAHKMAFSEDNAKHRFYSLLSAVQEILIFISGTSITWVIGGG